MMDPLRKSDYRRGTDNESEACLTVPMVLTSMYAYTSAASHDDDVFIIPMACPGPERSPWVYTTVLLTGCHIQRIVLIIPVQCPMLHLEVTSRSKYKVAALRAL